VPPVRQCPAEVSCAGCVLPSRPSPCSGLSPPLSTMRDKTPQGHATGFPLRRLPVLCSTASLRFQHCSVSGFPLPCLKSCIPRRCFPTAGACGASQVLRHLSSCMPRPVDSGGPASPCQRGSACVAFGSVKTLGVRYSPFRSCTSTSGCAVTPTAYRIRCLRFAYLVRRVPTAPPWTQDSLQVGG